MKKQKKMKEDWCKIASKIIDLELELFYCEEFLNKKESKRIAKEIEELELKKQALIPPPRYNFNRQTIDGILELEEDILDLE